MDFDSFTPATTPEDDTPRARDITGATCCIGFWGPLAREVVAPLCTDDFARGASSTSAPCRHVLGAVPVTMMRVSYVGELGWEIYTDAATVRRCGTCCGRPVDSTR